MLDAGRAPGAGTVSRMLAMVDYALDHGRAPTVGYSWYVLEERDPKRVISRMARKDRKGKVLLDWSQNNGAKTTIAPYSLRARARASVATPRTWDEVEDADSLAQVHRTELPPRLDEHGDLMAALDE